MPVSELVPERVAKLLEEIKHEPTDHMQAQQRPRGVAVYCASSIGRKDVYRKAAISLGAAIAREGRPLVYGGGFSGLMGTVSAAVLERGGNVTGVLPYAMYASGGEIDKALDDPSSTRVSKLVQVPNPPNFEKLEQIVVQTMHERKIEMARRAGGFVGLPGGYGTFEEVFEVITWTQIGIHKKPVVLLNICGYYEPIRAMVKNAVDEGFIRAGTEQFAIFVDGPTNLEEHDDFDWGSAALKALDSWAFDDKVIKAFDWSNAPSPKPKELAHDKLDYA